jgi:hypothetical protein
MDFKLVSKNNMGVVTTLILVILLSQSSFFGFLIDTPLGRMVLLAFVILIAYTHKILGLLAVLFIILAFNFNDMNMVHSYNYYEGFDGSGNQVKDAIKTKLQAVQQDMSGNTVSTTASNNASTTATSTSSSVSGTETFKGNAREGFCMTDRESNMLRGKQSNTMPVSSKLREQTDDVSPSENSIFSSDYAPF